MAIDKIIPDDENFTKLLQQTLNGLYEDLKEAENNCKRYEAMLTNPATADMNLALYGPLLNDSLKIKATVKDKIIKILGTLKDRVRVKEQQKADGHTDTEITEADYAEMLKKINEVEKKENE